MSSEPTRAPDDAGLVANLRRLPVTATICALAIVMTIAGKSSGYERFVIDARAFAGEPWRLLVAHFVHADVIHLGLNLAWLWMLGRILEPRLGRAAFVAFVLFVTLGGGLAEHAFDRGAIGLSGLNYGMWGFLVVAGRRFPALRTLLVRSTHVFFVAWFFLGIAITHLGWAAISNVGHAAGAALGAVVACSVGPDLRLARTRAALPIAALAALLAAATVGRDRVNLDAYAHRDVWSGTAALERGDWAAAEEHFQRAVADDPRDWRSWWSLSTALGQRGEQSRSYDAAFAAYEAGLDDHACLDWLVDRLAYAAAEELRAGRGETALVHARRAEQITTARNLPDKAHVWWNLACVLERAGGRREAADAALRAVDLGRRDAPSIAWLAEHLRLVTADELQEQRPESAFAYARRGAELAPDSVLHWEDVRITAERTSHADWAERARTEIARIAATPK